MGSQNLPKMDLYNRFIEGGSVKKDEKHLSLRIEEKTLRKFDYVARYSDRSMNWMLISMIKRQIAAFESEHGRIEIDDESHEQTLILPKTPVDKHKKTAVPSDFHVGRDGGFRYSQVFWLTVAWTR